MRQFLACLMLLFVALPAAAQTTDPSVRAYLDKRQSLLRDPRQDLSQLSKAITETVAQAERVVDRQPQAALDKLAELERFMPLQDIPSAQVHMLASVALMKLGNTQMAEGESTRAKAMRQILTNEVGSGASRDDPLRAIMVADVFDWAKLNMGKFGAIQQFMHRGTPIYVAAFTGPGGNRDLYFQVLQGTSMVSERLFRPLPLADMPANYLAMVKAAQEKRAHFLADSNVPYLELSLLVGDAVKKAAAALQAGRPAEAVAELKAIERLRPIEEVPTPELISLYGVALGQTGDDVGQQRMRGLLFGINQAIAHSGDGQTPQSPVKVLFIGEEYAWMRDKGLKVKGQKVVDLSDGGKLDVLIGTDADGKEHEQFFDVAFMFRNYGKEPTR